MNEAQREAEQRGAETVAKALSMPLMQPVDPDGPPLPCGCTGCQRDAAWIVRFHVGTSQETGITGCGKHKELMSKLVARYVSG